MRPQNLMLFSFIYIEAVNTCLATRFAPRRTPHHKYFLDRSSLPAHTPCSSQGHANHVLLTKQSVWWTAFELLIIQKEESVWMHRHASWKHLNRELQSGPASVWMCLKSSTGLLLWQFCMHIHSHTPFQLFLFALAVVFSGQSYVGQRSLWFLWLTLMLLTHQHCNEPQLYEERWIGGNSINGEQMKNLSWHRMYKPVNAWYLTNNNNTRKNIQMLNLWASTRSPMISLQFIFGL